MTDRLKNMSAEDLSKLIDYTVKYDTGNKTVGDIKEELGLTNEEFDELYTLAMPAIRGYNEGQFWRGAYRRLETAINQGICGKKSLEKKLQEVRDILARKSIRIIKEERLKGWDAA